MNVRDRAVEVLNEFYLCYKSKPRHNAISLQLEKDSCEVCAGQLNNLLAWGNDEQIAEACNELEPRLKSLKEKIIIEVLRHGV